MSDILIKGIEMPKNCKECFACKAELSQEKKVIYVCCFAQTDCPLIPVPPHGRLIDASEKIKVQIYDDMTEDYHMVEMTIDDLLCQGWVEANAPTIIAAEGRE